MQQQTQTSRIIGLYTSPTLWLSASQVTSNAESQDPCKYTSTHTKNSIAPHLAASHPPPKKQIHKRLTLHAHACAKLLFTRRRTKHVKQKKTSQQVVEKKKSQHIPPYHRDRTLYKNASNASSVLSRNQCIFSKLPRPRHGICTPHILGQIVTRY